LTGLVLPTITCASMARETGADMRGVEEGEVKNPQHVACLQARIRVT
jgi:hypothetical protein